jgi:four helix bundle protein
MKTRQFRDLVVWKRAMGLAEAVYVATRSFPKEEMFGLTSQMRRAAVSVPSNIAEGQGRDSDRSFALFLSQAKGSLCELETQLELAGHLGLIVETEKEKLLSEATEIGRMLHGLRKTLRRNAVPAQ